MSVYYLGAFPPPYGGVTRKNDLLLKELERHTKITAVDFGKIKRRDFPELMKLIRALTDRDARYVVGVSGRKTRRRFCRLMRILNARAMSRSVLMLMGSAAANDIASDPVFQTDVARFRRIYAETDEMCDLLKKVGLNHTAIYPNPRHLPEPRPALPDASGTLRCVFFSLIAEGKGADLVLQAAAAMPEIVFDFYGPLEPNIESRFLSDVKRLENVRYLGVFSGDEEALYDTLGAYSVLLLPTRYKTEGIPGVLVEGKISGLAEVVSDFRCAHDMMEHGVDGWILPECSAAALVDALRRLDRDRALLSAMQRSSQASADRYDIAAYLPGILEELL